MKDGSSLSRPDTPGSIKQNEIFANEQAMESGSSQEDHDIELIKAQLQEVGLGGADDDLMPHVEKHVAKYDFAGTTDIELDIKKGDVIKVIEKSDNGWWKGVFAGLVGWFPESYMDPVPLVMGTGKSIGVKGDRDRAESAADAEVEKPRNMDETMATAGKRETSH